MGKSLSLNNKLKSSYSNLEKVSTRIINYHNEMNKKNFDDKEYRKKVKNDIKIYKDTLNENKNFIRKSG